jgi:hypothetical protein
MELKESKGKESSNSCDEPLLHASNHDQVLLQEIAATFPRPCSVVKAGKVRLGAGGRHPQYAFAWGETMRSIPFMLATAVSSVFLSGVVAPNAVLAQTHPPAPIVDGQPTARVVPAVSRTSSEKAVDDLDRQLSKKLNICRGC